LTKPTSPSLGTRVLYYAALAPAPGPPDRTYIDGTGKTVAYYYNPALGPEGVLQEGDPGLRNSPGPFPGLVTVVRSVAPDIVDLVLHDANGGTFSRQNVQNIAQWVSAGSDPKKSRFDYVDLTA
jgi:hypothetical protein